MTHQYTEPILRLLETHGLRPRPTTAPSLLRDHVNDLYRYELRRLRQGLLRGDFPKPAYASRVVALRARYPILSIPLPLWTVGGIADTSGRRC